MAQGTKQARGATMPKGFHPDRYRNPEFRMASNQMAAGYPNPLPAHDNHQGQVCPGSAMSAGALAYGHGAYSDYLFCPVCHLVWDWNRGEWSGCTAPRDGGDPPPRDPNRKPRSKKSQGQVKTTQGLVNATGFQKAFQQQMAAISNQMLAHFNAPAPGLTPHPGITGLVAGAPVVTQANAGTVTLQVPQAPAQVDSKAFPMAQALKLADSIEAAHREGKVSGGFSLRRQVQLARAWAALEPLQGPEDAFRTAFAVTAAERDPENREFYSELWFSLMATKLYPLPEIKPPKDKQTWHHQAGLVLALLQTGMPVWLWGDAGSGKSVLAKMAATHLDRPFHRFQGTRDRTVDDMVGGWGVSNGSTVFRYGVVPQAMASGAILNLDEGSALPSEVTFEFHAALEGNPLVILKNGGEVVEAQPGFQVVVCDNTTGQGERSEYVGTQPVNAAFRDRFLFLQIGPLGTPLRRKIMEQALNG